MNTAVQKLTAGPLRIAILAQEPGRYASLSQLVRELGHVVVAVSEGPSVALADSIVAGASNLPTVALGLAGEAYQGRLASDATPEQIDAALRAVAAGLSVTVADEFARGFEEIYESDERTLLTPREVEVLRGVSKGSTNKEIARELGISQHTVKFHLESLMRKLRASSRAEAVYKSIQLKLLESYRI